MEQQQQPEMSILFRMRIVEDDIKEIRNDMLKHTRLLTGGDDPKQGLVWISADLARLVGAQSELTMLQRKDLDERFRQHEAGAHAERRTSLAARLGYEALRQVVVGLVLAVMALLIIGILTYIRNGGRF